MSSGTIAQDASWMAKQTLPAAWRAVFCVGKVALGVSGTGVRPAFGRQLEIFGAHAAACDLELTLQWVEGLRPCGGRLLFDSGSVWTLLEDEEGLCFDFASAILGPEPYKRLRIDRDFRQGHILLNHSYFPDPATCNPLEYPLDELVVLHRLARERGVEVHAAGMRDAEASGYLFLGHSGAGKSTTTRLWTQRHNMTVLSDDRIILRESIGSDGQPEVWMHGTPWHGEAAFAAPERARIERLFILEHAPAHASANKITPLRGGQAVAEIMARSFLPFYDAVALENTMSFLEEIVAAIPCYRLEFLPDGSAVEAVRRFGCDFR